MEEKLPLASSVPSATMATRYPSAANTDATIWIQPITAVHVDAPQQQICVFVAGMIIHVLFHKKTTVIYFSKMLLQAGSTCTAVSSQFGQDLYVAELLVQQGFY